jgi:hypothetical protein
MGDPSPQDLQAAIDRILRRCRDAGKPIATGVITPWSIDAIAGQLAKGIQIFNVPSAWLIADAVATQLQAIEDVIPAELRERKATPVTRGAYGNTPETTGGSAGD